ncbi:hypothetical protein CYMTET_38556 [Cymbomonas tetramitiformis]|uniref:ATP-grasp domain-containing protein n=1 Tax=Cymbomonas tetramitiformis TaxID=36881 RepID=A0AAE0CE12_9CHLO|nr:hypothetical protein CYMTET_38556 [Cymbomonas tetramitiformis]|eukprot:gene6500-7793_t
MAHEAAGAPFANNALVSEGTVVVLTLSKHREGIWIDNLLARLRKRHPKLAGTVRILEVDTAEGEECLPVNRCPSWRLLVNRVSDAADPKQAKLCLALLQTAELWSIPVINGSRAYALGTNKVLHHHVLLRSGVRCPRSHSLNLCKGAIRPGATVAAFIAAAEHLLTLGCAWPLLVKPNSAGFGAGIRSFATLPRLVEYAEQLESAILDLPSEDGVLLLQEYIAPLNREIYRVWFLHGRAQCGVCLVRPEPGPAPPEAASHGGQSQPSITPSDPLAADRAQLSGCGGDDGDGRVPSNSGRSDALDSDHVSASSEFTGGCAGGTCEWKPAAKRRKVGVTPVLKAWQIPEPVIQAVERIAQLTGADCGSVELLYEATDAEPVYFDVNMLSTLPLLDGSVSDPAKVWKEGYDPWAELADSVAEKAYSADIVAQKAYSADIVAQKADSAVAAGARAVLQEVGDTNGLE